MWTEQIPLDDRTRLDVAATACGASGVSLTIVRNGQMKCAAHIADPATALLLLGAIAEAMDHMGWFSADGRGLVAAAVLAESQRLEARG